MIQKAFTYNGMTFKAIRQFKKHETFAFVSDRLSGRLGIHNYGTDVRKDKVRHWNHADFYKEAERVGAGKMDIFILNSKDIVVPCDNELFAYNENKPER
jgi:hypothetical protein